MGQFVRQRSRGLCIFFSALGYGLLPGCKSPDITPVVLRVMTYNIHHAEGLDGKVDLQRIANVIRQSNADAVALQEVDKNTERTGGINMPAELARLTGMNVAFGANLDNYQGGQYGTAILSRFPIESHENHRLKQVRKGEQRGVLMAVLKMTQGQLLFTCTHLDHTQDQAERLFSETQFADIFAGHAGLPTIFCGDFNDTPDSELYKRLSKKWTDTWSIAGKGNGYTMSSANPKRRIDYIWLSGKKKLQGKMDGRAENRGIRSFAVSGRDSIQPRISPNEHPRNCATHHRHNPAQRHPHRHRVDHLHLFPPK